MEDRIRKYIEAVVGVGVNIQPGQNLIIYSDVEQAQVARMALEIAYKRGAKDVMISWTDTISERLDYIFAPDEKFGVVPEWYKARLKHLVDEKYHILSIDSDDPDGYAGVDLDRIEKDDLAYGTAGKERDDQVSSSIIQWVNCAVPGAKWSRKVFPNATSDEEAKSLMWEAILSASRIDECDPVENWKKHVEYLKSKANKLNGYNFKELHYKNSLGTDLTIELPKGHRWLACGEKAKTGFEFIANIPTEEVFTVPHKKGANGVVYGTKPIVDMTDTIEDFWIRFEEGMVVEFYASKNQHLLEKLLNFDAGSKYLGEVALVPHSSPISRSGILWYNTLYDENASCHLAIGEGYTDCLKGISDADDEIKEALGFNQSLTHVDFMIGSTDLSITGTLQNGEVVDVFVNGEWAI